MLKEHFPACFKADGSFDVERLKAEIAGTTNVVQEGYELKFLGKSYAKLLASTETTTVIQPNEAHNNLPENANSENIYISGDNLDGLKHLLKSYNGAIKCIYIDPPYNTGSDGFVYADNFNYTKENLQEKLSVSEEEAERILDLTKRGSASHSAWLMFMYSRLLLARDLLNDDGVIFISIDDNEQANLKLLCDDVFGEENFVANFIWKKKGTTSNVEGAEVSYLFDNTLSYKRTNLGKIQPRIKLSETRSYDYKDDEGNYRTTVIEKKNEGSYERETMQFEIIGHKPRKGKRWQIGLDTAIRLEAKNRFFFDGEKVMLKIYDFEDKDTSSAQPNILEGFGSNESANKELKRLFDGISVFDTPKPIELLTHFFKLTTSESDIVLDFFSGSATTASSILKLNAEEKSRRKFITIQLPEVLNPLNPSQKAAYEFLKDNSLPTTLDYIGIERIKRAAAKLKEEHPDKEMDLGFKHYILQEPNQNTLDKLDSFDKASLLADTTIMEEFGKPTILATWLNADGYGLTVEAEAIDLAGYTAYYCQKHLYLIDTGFTLESMKALLSKYDAEGHFNPENMVLFGYSFPDWSINEMIEKNLRILNDGEKNLKINFNVRY